jgi:Protein of unknown function (DUF1579)
VTAIEALHLYVGDWSGGSRLLLHRPVEATFHCVMRSRVETGMQRQALVMRYEWEVEDEPQDGLLVLNEAGGLIAGYWFDSWHMANSSMALTGQVEAGRAISLSGNYPATEGPDWGWRIVLAPDDDARFRFLMFNITPGGDEELAVETDFARSTATPSSSSDSRSSASAGVSRSST